MTVYANGSTLPRAIVSGERIKTVDNSSGDQVGYTGETVVRTQSYINEFVHFTCTATDPNFYGTYYDYFEDGDTILLSGNYPSPFAAGTTYYIVNRGAGYVELSATRGGSPITPTTTNNDIHFYPGADRLPFATLRPFPSGSDAVKSVVFYAEGSNSGTDTQTEYFTVSASAKSKPSISGIYQDISIFIYNTSSATVLNLRSSANNHLFYKELKFTNYLNRVGTAKFSVVNPGDATSTEKDLLLAGSAATAQKDNLVAIFQGKSLVWSGKITRSIQNKTGLFDSPLVQTWDVDCESDIVRMKYQQVKSANKGMKNKQIGFIISSVVDRNLAADINWNGDYELGVRSSEGIILDYFIGDSDMFTQFMTLSKSLDFDWRTRLIHYRADYTRSGSVYTIYSTGLYPADYFIGRWMVVTSPGGGIISFGKITDNTTTTITCSMTNTPAASGTLIILLDPVLDFSTNLSTPDPVQTYKMNSQPWTGGNGYMFDDKTDRSMLATKITAKGKTDKGVSITTSSAAVTPWLDEYCQFALSSYITKRTEGRVIRHIPNPPSGTGDMWIEGWGWAFTSGDYYCFFTPGGSYYYPKTYWTFSGKEEVMYEGIRCTHSTVHGNLNGTDLTGSLCVMIAPGDLGTESPQYNYLHPKARYYLQVPAYIGAASGQDFLVNGENIDIDSIAVNSVHGYYILFLCDDTTNHRLSSDPLLEAHGPGTIAWMSDYYDESNPISGSPAYYHGIINQTYMSDIGITLPALHKYTTMQLLKNSHYYRKATFWCMFDNWWKTGGKTGGESIVESPPDVGDAILCLQDEDATATETIYGQLKNLWQVIGWTLDTTDMRVTVELGDFEKNVFTTMVDKTQALLLTVD
jgi:hypothetical protein